MTYSPGTNNWVLTWFWDYCENCVPTVNLRHSIIVGNTQQFGNIAGDRFWDGDFNGDGQKDLVFYSPGDSNWFFGTMGSGTSSDRLQWTPAGNTAGFGNIAANPFFVGRFSGGNRDEILFYSPGDSNWFIGRYNGGEFNWTPAGNTIGFGNIANNRFWVGDFNGTGTHELLFYSPGDSHWLLGAYDGKQFNWSSAGYSVDFGQQFWTGDFSGNGKTDLLAYVSSEYRWVLGTYDGTQLNWSTAGYTTSLGQIQNDQFWTGNFAGGQQANMLFYSPGNQNWWMGKYDGQQFEWTLAQNTGGYSCGLAQFDNVTADWSWGGNFTARTPNTTELLFYSLNDSNWFLGNLSNAKPLLPWECLGSLKLGEIPPL